MTTTQDHNKSGRKSKMKHQKDKFFNSTASLGSMRQKGEIQIPEELSLEQFKGNNGMNKIFLRVYCEKIRPGDHFKTISVFETTTAEKCVKELIETHFSKVCSPQEVALFEVIGRINPITNSSVSKDPLMQFSEVRCRLIEPQETINSIFFGSRAGSGLSRRVELRRLDYPHRSFPAAAYPGTRTSTPTPSPRPNNMESTATELRRCSVESNESVSGVPLIRRSMTPSAGNLTLRDSRRKSSLRIPLGPSLTLIRGLQPKYDIPMWDLTPIIKKQRRRSEMTIGTRPEASIRLFDPPDEQSFKSATPTIFAKFVGYDYPLTTESSSEHTGAIFIEPYINERLDGPYIEFSTVPSIYINDELINPGPELVFEKRLLHPGDFIYFGSMKQGYIFLFKDPRWIPDHRLELRAVLPNRMAMGGTMSEFNRTHSITVRNGNGLGNGRNTLHSDRSSDTDSSHSRLQNFSGGSCPDTIPRLANMRAVLSPLFPTVHMQRANQYGALDPLDSPRWSRTEPWRSAGLFAHLVRTAASFIIHPNPAIPNRDVDERDTKMIQDYAINYVKDMRLLMNEFYQSTRSKTPDLIVPELWFSLFCYNVAVYLSPGWLTNSDSLPGHGLRAERLRSAPWDGPDSQSSSPNSISDSHTCIESLVVVTELRESAYHLATESIDAVVSMAFQELPPYLKDFLNGPNNSPMNAHTFFPNVAVNFPELRHRLGKLVACFHLAFFPSGIGDAENGSSATSSPFHTASIDGSSGALDRLSEPWSADPVRMTKAAGQLGDHMDPNLYPESESDHGEHVSPYDRTRYTRQSKRTGGIAILSSRGSIDTASRIEAIVWRHILAHLSHHLIFTLLTDDSIPITWETGEKLLRGINWLNDWLRSQHLEAHRRPLNMIAEFANLLATPRDQLLKMTWGGMRSLYPGILPSLLKFILEEYEVDGEIRDMPGWRVDQRDANEADEDAGEVIDRVLNCWRSKESLLYSKSQNQIAPIYRTHDLWDLFNFPSTAEVQRRLDRQLESQRIDFRWSTLIRHYPGARAIPLMPEVDQDTLNRPQSRQANGRRSRAGNGPNRGNLLSPHPRRDLTRSNPNLLYRSVDQIPNFRMGGRRIQHENIVSGVGDRNGLPDRLKPAPSKGEPIRIIRSYNNEQQPERTVIVPDQPPTNPQEAALYHLKALAASLPHANFSELLAQCQSPVKTTVGSQVPVRNRNPSDSNYLAYENQPNFNGLRSAQSQMNGLHTDYQSYSPAMTEYPNMKVLNQGSRSDNRLAQSLWQLPTEDNLKDTQQKIQTTYGRQVAAASQNWEDFRLTMLRRGLERVRGTNPASKYTNPRHPMYSTVSSSLGNLHSMLNQPALSSNPNIIVEETPGGSTGSLADSFLDAEPSVVGRNDDLGDVLTRSTQHAMVCNVTLTRPQDGSFGVKLIDGERTQLDQPGVFILKIFPHTAAAENGQLRPGDRILAINGTDLTGLTYNESIKLLKSCGTKATFTIRQCDVSDPTDLLISKSG